MSTAVVLVTGGYDHSLRFWEASSGICYRTITFGGSQINRIEITSDKRLVAAAGNPFVRVYELLSFEEHKGNVTALGFQRDKKWMFTGSDDGTLRIWDMRAPKSQMALEAKSPVTSAVLHPNQGEIIFGDRTGRFNVWDLIADKRATSVDVGTSEFPVQSLCVAYDASRIGVATTDGRMTLWEARAGAHFAKLADFQAHDSYILKCCMSPDVKTLATASSDTTVKLWNLETLEHINTLKGHQRWVWDCVFSADSTFMVTASSDQTAKLWEPAKNRIVRHYQGHVKAVTAIALNDAGES